MGAVAADAVVDACPQQAFPAQYAFVDTTLASDATATPAPICAVSGEQLLTYTSTE